MMGLGVIHIVIDVMNYIMVQVMQTYIQKIDIYYVVKDLFC